LLSTTNLPPAWVPYESSEEATQLYLFAVEWISAI